MSTELLLELYQLKKIQLHKLRKKFTDEVLIKNRTFFITHEGGTSMPISVWRMFYYIDRNGDFINRGKRVHHHIARAIYESMDSKEKLEILEYIDGQT